MFIYKIKNERFIYWDKARPWMGDMKMWMPYGIQRMHGKQLHEIK